MTSAAESSSSSKIVRLHTNASRALLAKVDELENGPEFRSLVEETQNNFSKSTNRKVARFSELGSWDNVVRTFFRRSGIYSSSQDSRVSLEEAKQAFESAFARTHVPVTHLAPMEYVQLKPARMAFEQFSLSRLSASDLDQILGNSINEIFYSWAALNLQRLDGYWFITATESLPVSEVDNIAISIDDRISLLRPSYPPPVERALQVLILYDWQPMWGPKSSVTELSDSQDRDLFGWTGFDLPFVLRVVNDPLVIPRAAPSLNQLVMEPQLDEEGEEIGEVPMVFIRLDQSESSAFQKKAKQIEEMLGKLREIGGRWRFFELSLNYLLKAFFSSESEQILWHIVTIESLMGERGEGVTDRIARRLSRILGASERQRSKVRERFKELYALRCDMVHGNEPEKEALKSHLTDARDMARRSTLWFLNYLVHVTESVQQKQNGVSLPNREDLLLMLDVDDKRRSAMAQLLSCLPKGFGPGSRWD